MQKITRRSFLATASSAVFAATVSPSFATSNTQHVFVASGTPNGILAYNWDFSTATLTPADVAAKIPNVAWITFSSDRKYLFAASEMDQFNGLHTGAVTSFRVHDGQLEQLSARNSASVGTCHVAVDPTGQAAISADYSGGSAASFKIADGKLSPAVWNEHYTLHGPNADRQQSAHAHFAAFSPNNRFAYINDLGGDLIHIYKFDAETAGLSPAGSYKARPGAGPRTLHFHPNGHIAYSVNELDSTVDILEWNASNGNLTFLSRIELLPADYHGPTRACDTVITKDGRFVYFANRDNNFLYSFHADKKTGALAPIGRSNCGGKTPRSFTLDPTERWILVANQDSNRISIFARNPVTGVLAENGKDVEAATPMRILFV